MANNNFDFVSSDLLSSIMMFFDDSKKPVLDNRREGIKAFGQDIINFIEITGVLSDTVQHLKFEKIEICHHNRLKIDNLEVRLESLFDLNDSMNTLKIIGITNDTRLSPRSLTRNIFSFLNPSSMLDDVLHDKECGREAVNLILLKKSDDVSDYIVYKIRIYQELMTGFKFLVDVRTRGNKLDKKHYWAKVIKFLRKIARNLFHKRCHRWTMFINSVKKSPEPCLFCSLNFNDAYK